MKEFWIYILKCSDDSFYTGKTSSLTQRVNEHQIGKYKGYTYSRRPVNLVYSMKYYDVKEAIEAERKIKTWSRKKKETLISNEFELLHHLAACKNKSHYKNKG